MKASYDCHNARQEAEQWSKIVSSTFQVLNYRAGSGQFLDHTTPNGAGCAVKQ